MWGAANDDLLLNARMHLDGVVNANAKHHRKPRNSDQGEWHSKVSGQTKRPDHADQHNEQREQPPADVEEQQQNHHHDCNGDCAKAQHAALEVIINTFEQHWSTRCGDLRIWEFQSLGCLNNGFRCGTLSLDGPVSG